MVAPRNRFGKRKQALVRTRQELGRAAQRSGISANCQRYCDAYIGTRGGAIARPSEKLRGTSRLSRFARCADETSALPSNSIMKTFVIGDRSEEHTSELQS